MKKFFSYFRTAIALISILTLAACAQGQSVENQPAGNQSLADQKNGEQMEVAQTDHTQNKTELTLPVSYDFKAQYTRTGYHSDVAYPLAFLIDSRDALDQYFTDNAGQYDFTYSSSSYFDGSISFEAAIQNYDEKWFETHQLILAVLEEGSGSIRHKVADVSRTADDHVVVEITRYMPEFCTADMAEWHILVEVDRKDLRPVDQLQVTFTEDEKLVWLTSEECEKIQNKLDFADNYGFLQSSDGSYQCLTGMKMGDTLNLRVKRNMVNDWEPEEIYDLVLQEKPDGSYSLVSGRLQWEEGRLAEQSFFNVELSEFDSPVQVMIYPPTREDSGKFVIRIIQDNKVAQQITPWLPDGVEDGRLISMDAVAFPDYDMDGNTDMILIYTIEGGRVIDILDGYDLKNLSWQSEFEHNLNLANALMQRTEEELNMANVKKFLGYKGKGEKFSSWQEAYRFIARLEAIQESRYQYNLIYFDEEEVPELVVDLPGRVSLYTYADGQLYRLMDRWGYGMLGNNGYQYLPRGNKMFNRDSDYAGAIYSDTIIRMNSDHRLEEVVEIFTVNFDDKNGDGYPEEDEVQTLGEVSTSYIGDRVISEEEYTSYFAEAEKAEWISGEYGYEELLEKLGKLESQ